VTARHRAPRAVRPRRAAAAGSGVLSLLLLAAALLVAPLTAEATTGTLVRLAQLSPELRGVELVMSSVADPRRSLMVAALDYGELSPYQAVEPGDYVIAVRPAGSTEQPTVSRVVGVRSGTAYTVAAVSAKADEGLSVFVDDLAAPAADRRRVRVINAAPPAPQLDVRTAVEPLALGLPPGRTSEYRDVAPGELRLTVGAPGEAGVELPVMVAANQVASVVLTAGASGLSARVVVDAGGPAVVPPGPVHAGFGGLAGPRPGGAVSSAVLVVLAAVAAGFSARLARLAR
jgi:hypothetical protein